MKLRKSQLKLILLLNTVLLILVVAIAFEALVGNKNRDLGGNSNATINADGNTVNDTTEEYSPFRRARISLGQSLDLETNIGGSGEDTLVDAFVVNERLYLFGNTDSNDLDMTGSEKRAFMCILDKDLTTLAYYFIGERDSVLEGVILGEGGFLTAFSNSGRIKLELYDYVGQLLKEVFCNGAGNADFCEVHTLDGKYVLVTAPTSSPLAKGRLLLQEYDFDLNERYERLISSAYSLDHLGVFEMGGRYVEFFAASSDLGTHLGIATCSTAAEPTVAFVSTHEDYRPINVTPYSDGWAVSIIDEENNGAIILLSSDFRKKTVLYQCENASTGFTCFHDGIFYFGFYGEQSNVTAYDFSFSTNSHVERLSDTDRQLAFISERDFCLFAFGRGETVRICDGYDSCDLTFSATPLEHGVLLRSGNNFYFAASINKATADAQGNFGGSDVWICRLKI